VRDVGKNIRHAPGLEVTDDDLKIWLSDLKALFSDPTFKNDNPLAKDALDQLQQLENDELIIERSEVVVAIKDSVDYLRTLPVHSNRETLELQSRIDDLEVKYHRDNTCTYMIGPFVESGVFGLEDFYVPPNISRVILQSRQKYVTSEEPLTSLEQMLSSNRIIILSADAGVGKTTFCKSLVTLWCAVQEGKTNPLAKFSHSQNVFSDIAYLAEFTYLFCIQLRGNKCVKLEDIFFSHTELVDTELTRDNKAFCDLLSNETGLVILDGLDECDIPSISPLATNRKYTVLITSRPWKLANIDMPSTGIYTHAQINVISR
ncbi:hypothetical protein MAR_018007, partial [Mya arenaria]